MLVEEGKIDDGAKTARCLGDYKDAAVEPWGWWGIFYCPFGEKTGDFHIQGLASLGAW